MELTFEKIGDWYISEFEVTSDFNLHIEKEPKGDFYLYQRTSSSGQYDIIEDFGYKKGGDNVIDLDFQALVYPKWIKIKSAVKPLVATITTDGEVNEVVYQAKEIEITSNGTTKVTADTGYTALGSVNVKVNVPQSGGGNSGGGDNVVYLDITQAVWPMEGFLERMLTLMPILAVKESSRNEIMSSAMAVIDENAEHFSAIAILSNFRGPVGPNGDLNTNFVIEDFKQFGAFEITKEEFYHIPQDEVWPLNTQEDYKAAWDKLYPLVERYGADYINENKLSLAPWYKSLTLESEWGTVNISEIVKYRSGLNGESNEDAIQFDGCALTKRYEDGGITYHLFIDEA